MGEAGNAYSINLDKALEREMLPQAWQGAWERGYVHLDQALLLTILLANEEGPKFKAAGRRFVIRFIREAQPSFELLIEVLQALRDLPGYGVYPRGEGPEWELRYLAQAIRRAREEGKIPRVAKLRR